MRTFANPSGIVYDADDAKTIFAEDMNEVGNTLADHESRIDTLETEGVAGPPGADGASAYEVAVANGFVGNEAAWLASLIGDTGATGPQGPAGPSAFTTTLSNGSYSGITFNITTGAAFSAAQVGYIGASSTMLLGDADAVSSSGVIGISTASISSGATGTFLLCGFIRNDSWTFTPGGRVYLSTTTGALTQTAPSGADDVIQVLGVAFSASTLYFNPQLVLVVHS